MVKGDGVS